MPETVTLRKGLGIIEVQSFEDVLLADLQASRREICRLHEEHGVANVLVDARHQASVPGTMDLFWFAKDLPREIKIAVLRSEQQDMRDSVLFFETVARNRSLRVKVFRSREEALRWLG